MTSSFGLGDLAYYLFRPVAYATDLIWGTDLRNCDRCRERRKRWNRWAVPRWVALLFAVTLVATVFLWWRNGT